MPAARAADEASLRDAVRAYAAAISSGRPEAARQVYPSISENDLRAVASLRQNFGQDRYEMTIVISDIRRINDTRAEVKGRVFHNGIDDTGKSFQRGRDETMLFRWTGSTWVRDR